MISEKEFDSAQGTQLPYLGDGCHHVKLVKVESINSIKTGPALVFEFEVIESDVHPTGYQAKVFLARRSKQGFDNLPQIKRLLSCIIGHANAAGQLVDPDGKTLQEFLSTEGAKYLGNEIQITGTSRANKAGTGSYTVFTFDSPPPF